MRLRLRTVPDDAAHPRPLLVRDKSRDGQSDDATAALTCAGNDAFRPLRLLIMMTLVPRYQNFQLFRNRSRPGPTCRHQFRQEEQAIGHKWLPRACACPRGSRRRSGQPTARMGTHRAGPSTAAAGSQASHRAGMATASQPSQRLAACTACTHLAPIMEGAEGEETMSPQSPPAGKSFGTTVIATKATSKPRRSSPGCAPAAAAPTKPAAAALNKPDISFKKPLPTGSMGAAASMRQQSQQSQRGAAGTSRLKHAQGPSSTHRGAEAGRPGFSQQPEGAEGPWHSAPKAEQRAGAAEAFNRRRDHAKRDAPTAGSTSASAMSSRMTSPAQAQARGGRTCRSRSRCRREGWAPRRAPADSRVLFASIQSRCGCERRPADMKRSGSTARKRKAAEQLQAVVEAAAAAEAHFKAMVAATAAAPEMNAADVDEDEEDYAPGVAVSFADEGEGVMSGMMAAADRIRLLGMSLATAFTQEMGLGGTGTGAPTAAGGAAAALAAEQMAKVEARTRAAVWRRPQGGGDEALAAAMAAAKAMEEAALAKAAEEAAIAKAMEEAAAAKAAEEAAAAKAAEDAAAVKAAEEAAAAKAAQDAAAAKAAVAATTTAVPAFGVELKTLSREDDAAIMLQRVRRGSLARQHTRSLRQLRASTAEAEEAAAKAAEDAAAAEAAEKAAAAEAAEKVGAAMAPAEEAAEDVAAAKAAEAAKDATSTPVPVPAFGVELKTLSREDGAAIMLQRVRRGSLARQHTRTLRELRDSAAPATATDTPQADADALAVAAAPPAPPAILPSPDTVPAPTEQPASPTALEVSVADSSLPSLISIVKLLERELGLVGPMLRVVNDACTLLEVALEGSMLERALQCWAALGSPHLEAVSPSVSPAKPVMEAPPTQLWRCGIAV